MTSRDEVPAFGLLAELEPKIREITTRLIDAWFAGATDEASMHEFVETFGVPLPVEVISPLHASILETRLRRWPEDQACADFAPALARCPALADAFIDPLIGSYSDSFKGRYGRRHTLMYLAIVPTVVFVYLLFVLFLNLPVPMGLLE